MAWAVSNARVEPKGNANVIMKQASAPPKSIYRWQRSTPLRLMRSAFLPAGVCWRLHERLDQLQLYCACYALLTVSAVKLLWDGLPGYNLL